VLELLTQHQFWAAVVVYWIFSAAVSSMPDPASNGSSGYLWLFRFLHTIAGNLTTAFGSKIPGLKAIACTLLIPVLLSASACRAHYTIHPGALNLTDSAAYDTLLAAEATIDQARKDYQAGRLPAEARRSIKALIQFYNITRESWLTYRGAIATNVPSDVYFTQLTKNHPISRSRFAP
jgi:hypothetical protein